MYYGRFTESEWECYAWARAYKTKEEAKAKKQKLLAKQVFKGYRVKTNQPKWTKAFWANEDTYVNKMFINTHLSKEDWKEFKDEEWIRTGSEYDCSGKEFTVSMDRYEVPNGTWIYHRVSFDY